MVMLDILQVTMVLWSYIQNESAKGAAARPSAQARGL